MSASFVSNLMIILNFNIEFYVLYLHAKWKNIFAYKKGLSNPRKANIFFQSKNTIISSETWKILKLRCELKNVLGTLKKVLMILSFLDIYRFNTLYLLGKYHKKLSCAKRRTLLYDRKPVLPRSFIFSFWALWKPYTSQRWRRELHEWMDGWSGDKKWLSIFSLLEGI